jgi:hypothetical protein
MKMRIGMSRLGMRRLQMLQGMLMRMISWIREGVAKVELMVDGRST